MQTYLVFRVQGKQTQVLHKFTADKKSAKNRLKKKKVGVWTVNPMILTGTSVKLLATDNQTIKPCTSTVNAK